MRIAVVGSGNVATHLARALHKAGHCIVAVASSHLDNALRLAREVDAEATDDVASLPIAYCDLILIAVTDRAVADVVAKLPVGNAIVAHTSGSVPLSVLTSYTPRAGVFYPLQTFSRAAEVDVTEVPFFIEGSTDEVTQQLFDLASELSASVHKADSSVRARLHIAGVLTSNFPIYLLEMARQVLDDIPLDVVRPLAYASLTKAFEMSPVEALTGPARRGDVGVIERQANALPDDIRRRIYLDISEAILSVFHPDKSIKTQ